MGDKFKLVLKIEERFNAGNAQRKVFGKIKGRPNKKHRGYSSYRCQRNEVGSEKRSTISNQE